MNFATWFFFYIYHCKATICKAYFIRLDINTSQFNLFRWKLLVVKQHALQESKEIKRWVKEIKLSRRVSGVIYGACCHGNAGSDFNWLLWVWPLIWVNAHSESYEVTSFSSADGQNQMYYLLFALYFLSVLFCMFSCGVNICLCICLSLSH